jgi:hypothetical protein
MKPKSKAAALPGLSLPADPAPAQLGFKRDPVLKSARVNTSMKGSVSGTKRVAFPSSGGSSSLKASSPQTKTTGSLGELVKGRLRVGLALSRAEALNGANVDRSNQTIGTVDFSSGSQPSVEIRWSSSLYRGQGAQSAYDLNYFASLSMERERQLGSARFSPSAGLGSPQTLTFNADIPTYQANILTAGVEWKLSSALSLPVGLTLPIFTRTSIRNGVFDLGPRAGLMLGLILSMNPNSELELSYRAVNYAMTLKEFQQSDTQIGGAVQMQGMNLALRYIF